MARSVHTTKKDLTKERKFSANDGVLPSESMTELEEQDIQKTIYKINAKWVHQAKKQDSPIVAKISRTEKNPKKSIVSRKLRTKVEGDT